MALTTADLEKVAAMVAAAVQGAVGDEPTPTKATKAKQGGAAAHFSLKAETEDVRLVTLNSVGKVKAGQPIKVATKSGKVSDWLVIAQVTDRLVAVTAVE